MRTVAIENPDKKGQRDSIHFLIGGESKKEKDVFLEKGGTRMTGCGISPSCTKRGNHVGGKKKKNHHNLRPFAVEIRPKKKGGEKDRA